MIYEVEWNNKAKEHLGRIARTGKKRYNSFKELLKDMPADFDGHQVLTPEIQDCQVHSDEDIKFWMRFGLKELPLYAKHKSFLLYQDIRAGEYPRSVEVARVKFILT